MNFTRDRRDYSIDTNGSSAASNSNQIDTRTGIDRRSGSDRRCDYDEQRKAVRSKLKTGAFVILKQPRLFKRLKPHKIKFAVILDISFGGLRAQYVCSDIFPYKSDVLSIVTDDGIVKIEDIPFKIITDYKFTRLPDNTYLRRCGIKFGSLTDSHKLQLNQLMRDYSESCDAS
jgi:hypothetical protein